MGSNVLYSFRRCPYAMRARMGLLISGIDYEHREVVLKNKPQAMLKASPKATVPVLVLEDGQVIDESIDIMTWALAQHDPKQWLSHDLTIQLDFIKSFESTFKENLDKYKYSNRYADANTGNAVDPMVHRKLATQVLEQLNATLKESGFIFTQSWGLADMATFPFVRQFANTDRAYFDSLPLTHLQSWLDKALKTTLFERCMVKIEPWQEDEIHPKTPG